MIVLLFHYDWQQIESILGGAATFIVLMSFLFMMWHD